MSRLSESVARVTCLLDSKDLADDGVVAELLAETTARRGLDLCDLSPREQADLIAGRSVNLLPSSQELAEAIEAAHARDGQLTVKYGIDPTSADVHIGHIVPIMLANRFQRMGHHVIFIIGDATVKIGDPSGRTSERPQLTDEDIAANLSTYQQQVTPFIDFERAELRFNGEWLNKITLPELVAILAHLPVSMPLQREDFRSRLAQGEGLSMAEFLYSVVMALDSVAITADLELGGVDQLLNLQMCRKVMEVSGQHPEMVVTTQLIEGTDGTGAKMSKSKGNYVPLSASPDDIYGRMMSIPDRLLEPYFEHLTEWTDTEIQQVAKRREDGSVHPMALKRILAGEITAAIHGADAAAAARDTFTKRFSQRSFGDVDTLPTVTLHHSGGDNIGTIVARELEFAPSASAVRRVAKQNGLRLITENGADQSTVILDEDAVPRPLNDVLAEALPENAQPNDTRVYLKVGRHIARIEQPA